MKGQGMQARRLETGGVWRPEGRGEPAGSAFGDGSTTSPDRPNMDLIPPVLARAGGEAPVLAGSDPARFGVVAVTDVYGSNIVPCDLRAPPPASRAGTSLILHGTQPCISNIFSL